MDEITKKWFKYTDYLNDIKDSFKRSQIALCLENQRLMNSQFNYHDFDKYLLDLTAKVFTNFKLWDWVSVQNLLGPTSLVYYMREVEDTLVIENQEVPAHTRRIENFIFEGVENIKKDADFIIYDIEKEVLTDLWNNCSISHSFSYKSSLKSLISNIIKDRKFNYMVASDEDLYEEILDFQEDYAIYRHGGLPSSGVLLGRKGESYMQAGYVYSPYIPFTFTFTPVVLDPVEFIPKRSLLTRCGKWVVRGGPSYYGKLVFEG